MRFSSENPQLYNELSPETIPLNKKNTDILDIEMVFIEKEPEEGIIYFILLKFVST